MINVAGGKKTINPPKYIFGDGISIKYWKQIGNGCHGWQMDGD